MCGRYTLGVSPARIAEVFELADEPAFQPRFNIAPTQDAPVVVATGAGRRLELRRFGLVPHWAGDPRIGSRLLNARAESVAEKPAFRDAYRRHRCLVPADGFYEWKPQGRRRQPFHVRRRDEQPFAMAGVCDTWHARQPDAIASFAILTTEADALVRPIHDRMPLILAPGEWSAWLDPGTAPDRLGALLARPQAPGFEAYAVDPRVNSPHVDDPSCREPIRDTMA
jgi:putative SOS response-associated peptidase YedK